MSKQHLMVDYAGVLGHQQSRRTSGIDGEHAISLPVAEFSKTVTGCTARLTTSANPTRSMGGCGRSTPCCQLVNQLMEIDCASWLHLNEARRRIFRRTSSPRPPADLAVQRARAESVDECETHRRWRFSNKMIFSSEVKLVKPDAAIFEWL